MCYTASTFAMREILEQHAEGYEWYKARREEFDTGQKIPFRVSPEPLKLTSSQRQEIATLGCEITQYVDAVNELYNSQSELRNVLNAGKPEILLSDKQPTYLFVRPDIIITPTGFSICEIETSPFGLALAELLNRGYRDAGFETLVGDNALASHVSSSTPAEGILVYSNKTSSFAGQINFLANEIFSGENRSWRAENADITSKNGYQNIYRAFYQAEYLTDPSIHILIDNALQNSSIVILPSLSPHLEEKAILAILWDKRWQDFLQKQLGNATFNHLRDVVPPTWIVGQEQYFAPGLPDCVSTSVDLASLSRSKRALVIKSSGFSKDSSWGESVNLLHEKSVDNAKRILLSAQNDTETLHIVQQFKKGKNVLMSYENTNGTIVPVTVRVRLTPYFSMIGSNKGQLIAIKATGCENTDFIHASSTSINTAVAEE